MKAALVVLGFTLLFLLGCTTPDPGPGPCTSDANCSDQNVATTDICDLNTGLCSHIPITTCDSNDSYCPPNCTDQNDSDCAPFPSLCDSNSQCSDDEACTIDLCDTNSFTCSHTPIIACINNDLCCPANCTDTNDSDCSSIPPVDGSCDSNSDCVDDNNSTNDFCDLNTSLCGHTLKTCNQLGGHICLTTQRCTVLFIPAFGTGACCPGTCVCDESWTCGNWGSCDANHQTRTCTDSANCGTTTERPILDQNCSSTTCTPADLSEYQCSGNWRQRRHLDANCSYSWTNYQECTYGCFGGDCNAAPDPGAWDVNSPNNGFVPFQVTGYGRCPTASCTIEWGDDQNTTVDGNFTRTHSYIATGTFTAKLWKSDHNQVGSGVSIQVFDTNQQLQCNNTTANPSTVTLDGNSTITLSVYPDPRDNSQAISVSSPCGSHATYGGSMQCTGSPQTWNSCTYQCTNFDANNTISPVVSQTIYGQAVTANCPNRDVNVS